MSTQNCTNTISSSVPSTVSLAGSKNGFASALGTGSRDGLIKTVIYTLLVWQERSRSRSKMRTMDLHRLNDIGLTYEQAKSEFEKPFWKA